MHGRILPLFFAFLLFPCTQARSAEIDVDLDLEVRSSIDTFILDYRDYGEELSCDAAGVKVVRRVEFFSEVEATASADAVAAVSVDGEDYDSLYEDFDESGSDESSDALTEESFLTTALASPAEIAKEGFRADAATCSLIDNRGAPLGKEKVLALVKYVDAKRRMKAAGAMLKAKPKPAALPKELKLRASPAFD
ncbi:hypothetical protein ACFL2T_03695 [Elusimicrobiota bacterium]